jgi:hypothetical protein
MSGDAHTPGLNFESFGGVVGVSKNCLYKWLSKHKDFDDAKKIGDMLSLKSWIETGIKGMREEKFNATVWIFMMKNMHGWRDKIEQTTSLNIEGIAFIDEDED